MIEIIMSIQTKYARKIFSGNKKWEFRKNIPSSVSGVFPNKIIVYSSGEDKALIGEFIVKRAVRTSFTSLMEVTNSNTKEDLEWFSKYYKNKSVCCAMEVGQMVQYPEKIHLSDIVKVDSSFRPPQNFYYLDNFPKIKRMLSKKTNERNVQISSN